MEPPPHLEDWLAGLNDPPSRRPGQGAPRIRQNLPEVPDHELLRCIGHGAYGEVWLARNALGTPRAVKFVFLDSFSSQQPYEREFRGIKHFEPVSRRHDGLMDILQVGRNDDCGYFYYVMELADDALKETAPTNPATAAGYIPKTLARALRQQGRLPTSECLQLGLDLTSALGHLHRHGLIHRDVKPSNIIFVQGVSKLADIGLVAEVEEALSFVGTEGYIPPEGPISPQADLYSLGKVLYEASMGKDRKEYPEPLTGLRELLQANEREALLELNSVILRACAEVPSERYQTAEQMHVDLALVQSGGSVRSKRLTEKRLATARRVAVVVAFVAALATGAWRYQSRLTNESRRLQEEATRQQHLAESYAATMQMQKAEELLQRGESARGLALLANVLRRHPGHRAAAERILAALSQRRFPVAVGKPLAHKERLIRARFSPDGEWVATAAEDNRVRLWHAATAAEAMPPWPYQDRIDTLEFSEDGQALLSAAADGTVCLLDVKTGGPLFAPIQHNQLLIIAALSRDGESIITLTKDGVLRRISARTGEAVAQPTSLGGEIHAAALSPHHRRLAVSTEEGGLTLWDPVAQKPIHQLAATSRPRILCFNHDGTRLAIAGRAPSAADIAHDWEVHVWSVESGRLLAGPMIHDHVTSMAFSPDGTRIVTTDIAKAAVIWNSATGEPEHRIAHAAPVTNAAFHPDGKSLVVASKVHSVRLFAADSGAELTEPIRHDGPVSDVAFSRDGRRLLTVGREDGAVRIWMASPAHSPPPVLTHAQRVPFATFDPTGRRVLTATGSTVGFSSTGISFDLGDQQFVHLWQPGGSEPSLGSVLPRGSEALAIRFTRDGPRALIAHRITSNTFGRVAHLWDPVANTTVGEAIVHPAEITCASLSEDGRCIAIGSKDGTISVRQTSRPTHPPTLMVDSPNLRCLRFSAENAKLVSASETGTVRVWEVATGRALTGPLRHGAGVWFAQFDAAADFVVSTSRDYSAVIWALDGRRLARLPHRGPVEHSSFSPDGTRLVTASGDRTARLWSRTGRQLIGSLEHDELVVMARFSPDGLRILTASADGAAQVWDAATGLKLGDPMRHGQAVLSAEFNRDGTRIVTSSLDKSARIWEVPVLTEPVPSWLPDLAESIAGHRLDENGVAQRVSWEETLTLRGRLSRLSSDAPGAKIAKTVLGLPH